MLGQYFFCWLSLSMWISQWWILSLMLRMIMEHSILALVVNTDKTPSRSLATSVKLSHFSWQEQCLGAWKVFLLCGSSRTIAAPKTVPRSINSRVCRSCMDCTVLGPTQLSTFTVHVRKLVCRQNENLGNPVHLICDDFCAFCFHVILIEQEWAWRLEVMLQCWYHI
jgi:hypothetical protein